MPAAILVAKKLKPGDSAAAIGRELDRRSHVYENDVDPSRTHLNEYLINGEWVRADDPRGLRPEPLDVALDRRLGELNTKRKIRKDAVRAVGFVISTNGRFDNDAEAVEWLKKAVDWMGERYGHANLIAAALHMDETTHHAQVWIVPAMHDEETGYDRLSCKELFSPDKLSKDKKAVLVQGTMSRLQRDFYEQVAKPSGFDEPMTRERRMARGVAEYKSLRQFKADKAAREAEARAEAASGREFAADLAADEHVARADEADARARKADELARDAEARAAAARERADALAREIDGARGELSAVESEVRDARAGLESVQEGQRREAEEAAGLARAIELLETQVRALVTAIRSAGRAAMERAGLVRAARRPRFDRLAREAERERESARLRSGARERKERLERVRSWQR